MFPKKIKQNIIIDDFERESCFISVAPLDIRVCSFEDVPTYTLLCSQATVSYYTGRIWFLTGFK